ncbi:MAG TPA: nicotinate (nicotinamide) nucleotide adenylyltransferase [Sulfurospirillum arcachonense]|nr:nicotinate (nicotinamide) nucleotide adenylyltransferase [Sulfurospirillum arcachonense]
MDIAVFGGSFDPPHLGHEEIVKEALNSLHVEKIFVIPTYLNPFKKEFFAPSELRLKWLKKLFTCREVEILDFEVKQKRAVSTIETIEYLKSIYDLDKIYLIIGADNLASIESWHRYSELKDMVEFVVASRDETNFPKELKKLSINAKISSSKLRSNMSTSFIPHKIKEEVIEFYKDKNGK